ncbi:E3 SUMO-protein ligase PIAS1 like [Verticillium longisporum]|nr:E3 SUMO-protein ligase PIAS1 like [Verticillium longisporum]
MQTREALQHFDRPQQKGTAAEPKNATEESETALPSPSPTDEPSPSSTTPLAASPAPGEIVSGPLAIKPDQSIHQLDFEVSDDELKRLSTYSMSPGERQVLCDYFDGRNVLKLSVSNVTPKAGHATMVAVEKVVTLTHSRIMAMVSERGNGGDDDDAPIIFSNLSIDLADPFTATMFKIPVRGSSCTHLECFDLGVWLGTRLGKSTSVHSLKCGCGLCRRSRALGAEPSLTDKWKCPLCDKDARPGSLRVDGFMVEVREALVRRGLTRTKSINVGPDGTWSPKAEQPDSEDEEDVEADSQRPPKRAKTGHQTEVRGTVEVIVLD